ncbi:MAG: hypothetical protein M3O61_04580 [Gemmatimonadota bacterium]|nr:hypothetical protein [Gemmatimonadota bacterium]
MNELPPPDDRAHVRYRALWDRPDHDYTRARAFVEHLYARSQAYLDADIRRDLPRDFSQRFWEMCIATMLLDAGVELCPRSRRPNPSRGPDILLADGTTWIEAVSVGAGEGPDALQWPTGALGTVMYVPDERVSLRLLSVIFEKLGKAREYLSSGLVKPGDRYIVAVNAAEVPWARQESAVPRIVRSLFPIGSLEVTIGLPDGEVKGIGHAHRPHIRKELGAQVPTSLFLQDESALIGAVLYACVDEFNVRPEPKDDLILVHNPRAANPVPVGWVRAGHEYYLEGEAVKHVDHRSNAA